MYIHICIHKFFHIHIYEAPNNAFALQGNLSKNPPNTDVLGGSKHKDECQERDTQSGLNHANENDPLEIERRFRSPELAHHHPALPPCFEPVPDFRIVGTCFRKTATQIAHIRAQMSQPKLTNLLLESLLQRLRLNLTYLLPSLNACLHQPRSLHGRHARLYACMSACIPASTHSCGRTLHVYVPAALPTCMTLAQRSSVCRAAR